jgi:hypothetical protein
LPMSSRRTRRASCTARRWRESSFSGIREELGVPISSSLSTPQKRAHGCILCSDNPFPSTPIEFLTHIRWWSVCLLILVLSLTSEDLQWGSRSTYFFPHIAVDRFVSVCSLDPPNCKLSEASKTTTDEDETKLNQMLIYPGEGWGWGGTHKVSSSVVWNRCCCRYCYSWRQTNTQSFQLHFLLLALLLLLLYFGHHPISSTSSSIASSPTTDEAQPITELRIGELQWIGFPLSTAGGVADRPRRRERSVRRRCCVRERLHFGDGGKRRGWRGFRLLRIFFPSFQNPMSFALVSRVSFNSSFFFSLLAPEPGTSAAPTNPGPESRALNNRGPWSRGRDESRALKNNRGPESRGPVNVKHTQTPGGYQGGSLNSWQFLEKKSYTRF